MYFFSSNRETSFGPVTVTINELAKKKEENENEDEPTTTETESPVKRSPPEPSQEDEIQEVRLEDPKIDLDEETKVKSKSPVVIDVRESVYEEVRIEDKPMDSISIKTDDGDVSLAPDVKKNQSDASSGALLMNQSE